MRVMTEKFVNPLPGVPHVESPFFEQFLAATEISDEWRRIAVDLHRDGYAVFDFPDTDFDARAESIKTGLKDRYDWAHWFAQGYAREEGLRIQDAWTFDENIKALATNATVLHLLSTLYGRRAWPFQTLNFPVGTQQHFHTDSVHFSSVPERYMCGVWIALEDINADSGPLMYYPGSHAWPIYVNEHVCRHGGNQQTYEPLWRQLVELHDIQPVTFQAKKGQALIWAANLLHGGSRQKNPHLTRWSQVTHYYFDDCAYYTPLHSNPFAGQIHFRDMVDISTDKRVPNSWNGSEIPLSFIDSVKPRALELPPGFDPAAYLAANPDVAAAGADPQQHYLQYGFREGRKLAL